MLNYGPQHQCGERTVRNKRKVAGGASGPVEKKQKNDEGAAAVEGNEPAKA